MEFTSQQEKVQIFSLLHSLPEVSMEHNLKLQGQGISLGANSPPSTLSIACVDFDWLRLFYLFYSGFSCFAPKFASAYESSTVRLGNRNTLGKKSN